MKTKFLTIGTFVLILLISACGQNRELSEADRKLISETGFDSLVIGEIRTLTDSAFSKSTGSLDGHWNFRDSMNYVVFSKKGLTGLTINESQKKSTMIVSQLRDKFNEKGYFIYISESNYGYAPDEITVLKTDDKFDILRFEGTSGINFNIYVEDVIEKLTPWDKDYGLKIFGVGVDFLEADYLRLPEDLDRHAEELYDFCPDIVDQGTGSVEELKREIENSRRLFLWWD